jgi:hypothetical protein
MFVNYQFAGSTEIGFFGSYASDDPVYIGKFRAAQSYNIGSAGSAFAFGDDKGVALRWQGNHRKHYSTNNTDNPPQPNDSMLLRSAHDALPTTKTCFGATRRLQMLL